MENKKKTSQLNKTRDIVYISIFIALITICAWIAIPATVPFTLQTLGIFTTVGFLGGKKGSIAVFIYILLGIIGIPVFSGYNGGISAILGPSGGYILGFLFLALCMWLIEYLFGHHLITLLISMIIGLFACYAFGTLWFMISYTQSTGTIAFSTVLGWCVIPFIIPDFIKIFISLLIIKRIKNFKK